jgi:hypothetical protein
LSFHFNFIAKDRARALAHLADLRQAGSLHNVPEPVFVFVESAIEGIRRAGPISVTAQGHMVLADTNSYDVSSCTIEVKPLESLFIE